MLGEGGFGAVFESKENPNIVIKTENAMWSEEQFREEVELQSAAAKGGFVCPVMDYAVEILDKRLYGKEPQIQQKFYIMVMPKMSYSLQDVIDHFGFLDLFAA